LLLPVVRKAREQGRIITCGSNLRQWGLILHEYVIDNKGLLPETFCFAGTGNVGRYPPTFAGLNSFMQGVISAEMFVKYQVGIDLTNKKVTRIFMCPSTEAAFEDVDRYITNTWTTYGWFEANYAYFGHFEKYSTTATKSEQLTGNKLRGDRVLMCDQIFFWGPGPGWDYNHGKFGPSISDPAFRGYHDLGPPKITGINVLMGDGSVRWKGQHEFDPVKMQTLDPSLGRVKAVNPASASFY